MKTHEIKIEFDSREMKDDTRRLMAHPAILKNFRLIAEDRFANNRCLCHNNTIDYEVIDDDTGMGYQLKTCCDGYGKLGAKFLSRLRDDMWKLCMVMALTHKKTGSAAFAQTMEKLEKYEFKGVNDFFDTFFDACIKQAIVDDAGVSDFLKEDFEKLMKGSQPSVH